MLAILATLEPQVVPEVALPEKLLRRKTISWQPPTWTQAAPAQPLAPQLPVVLALLVEVQPLVELARPLGFLPQAALFLPVEPPPVVVPAPLAEGLLRRRTISWQHPT
jgi:hypothetical protein